MTGVQTCALPIYDLNCKVDAMIKMIRQSNTTDRNRVGDKVGGYSYRPSVGSIGTDRGGSSCESDGRPFQRRKTPAPLEESLSDYSEATSDFSESWL